MIYRNRLPRPSRYLPVVAAALAVMVLMPEGMIPGGDSAPDTAQATDTSAEAPLVSIVAAAPPAAELGLQRPGSATAAQPDASALQAADTQARPQPTGSLPEADPVQMTALDPSAELDAPAEPASTASTDAYFLAARAPMTDGSAADGTGTDGSVARVGNSALNVRAGPSSSTAKLFVLQPGEQVRVAETNGSWALVVRGNGESGWAYSRYLAGPELAASRAATAPQRSRPDASTATVDRQPAAPRARERIPGTRYARIDGDVAARAGPSRNAPRLFVVPAGERVAIAEIRDGWAHVVLEGGISGWVRYR